MDRISWRNSVMLICKRYAQDMEISNDGLDFLIVLAKSILKAALNEYSSVSYYIATFKGEIYKNAVGNIAHDLQYPSLLYFKPDEFEKIASREEAIKLASVINYLMAEICEIACMQAKQNNSQTITKHFIQQAILFDNDLPLTHPYEN